MAGLFPFGLFQTMALSLPMGRRATKCLIPGASAVYLFNEGSGTVLRDLSGNGNDGTLGTAANAPTWGAGGLTFDGADFVNCGTALRGFSAGLTVQVVVKQSADGVYQGIVGNNSSTGATGAGWFVRKVPGAGTFKGTAYDGNGNSATATLTANAAGEWSCVTMVYNGETLTGYAGGTAFAPAACVGLTEVTTEPCRIGAYPTTTNGAFAGDIAAVLVYPFALTPSQIAQNRDALNTMMALRGPDINL